MKTHRCYHDAELASGDVIQPVKSEAHHLLRVRRAKSTDRILVVNGRGVEFSATMDEPTGRYITLHLHEQTRFEESPPVLPVLAPVLTPDTDSIIATAVELGVSAFRPLISSRCTVPGAEKKAEAVLERWRRLTLAALKQCERLWLPSIHAPMKLEAAIQAMVSAGEVPVCLAERSPASRDLLAILDAVGGRTPCFLVGPEGGWDPREMDCFAALGVERVGLGDAILRAETASVMVLASSLAHRARADA